VTGSLNVSDDSTTRTNLGLGTIATQDSDSITVTGGTATLGALTVSGSDSGDLVRITQTGSGNALVVEDSTNPDSTPFVVDASGNVGVGTSSPSYKLHVRSADATSIFVVGNTTESTQLEVLTHQDDRVVLRSNDSGNGRALAFETGTTERMRIDSSGATRFGDTFVGDAWNINSGIFSQLGSSIPFAVASNSIVAVFNRHSSTGTVVEFKQGTGPAVGKIDVTASSTSYVTSSDYRLKENITEITDGITRVKQLNPSRFNFIADPENTVHGFIAHEVQDIVREAVTGEKDAVDLNGNPEYQGVDYGRITPLLTAALKEAIEKIEMLEARIAVLEAK
jgi:DNA-binding protein YbaB